jgi:hypothetical protein
VDTACGVIRPNAVWHSPCYSADNTEKWEAERERNWSLQAAISTDFHLNYLLWTRGIWGSYGSAADSSREKDTNEEFSVDTLSVLCSDDAPM